MTKYCKDYLNTIIRVRFFDRVVDTYILLESETNYVLNVKIPGANRSMQWTVPKDSDAIVEIIQK
jgi:hypothetical protein